MKEFVIDKKSIGTNTLAKAASTLLLAILVLFISSTVIFAAESKQSVENMVPLMFEQISAYSTCGLSMGITQSMSTLGKFMLILDMYLGRIGAFTFFMSFYKSRKRESKNQIP